MEGDEEALLVNETSNSELALIPLKGTSWTKHHNEKLWKFVEIRKEVA